MKESNTGLKEFEQPKDSEISPNRVNTFSVYRKPISNPIPLKGVTVNDVCKVMRSNRYKDITKRLRSLSTDAYRTEKGKVLDYVTFSGIFTKRANNSIIQRSGLFCIDLDDLHDLEQTKSKVLEHFAPTLIFTSPSGKGLKVVYKIDVNEGTHLEYFQAFESFFNSELNLKIDDKCKDVSRACFLCHDPNVYINENADILEKSFIDTFLVVPTNTGNPNTAKGSSKGTTYNLTTKPLSEKNTIIEKLKTWLNKKMTFSEGNRNGYITQFAGALNRYGIDRNEALNELLSYAENGFSEKEIKATVNSIYRNTSYFNTASFDEDVPYTFEVKKEAKPIDLLPINDFPEPFRNFINEYTNVYRVPQDYIAGSVFFAVAMAIGNKLELKDKYYNIPIHWMTLVGDPSTGKTNPLQTALYPFESKDKESFNEYKDDLKRFLSYEKLSKKEKEHTDEVSEPTYFQYLLNDYTPEALAKVHEINSRGLCIYRDELKGWIDDFNRYSKSGEQSNILSTFLRSGYKVNRAGKDKLPILISDPAIYVTGGIQPDLLKDLASDKRAENGFCSRMLFIYPDNSEKPEYTTKKLSKDTLANYFKLIESLTQIPETVELSLSKGAEDVYMNWYNENKEKVNNEVTGYLKGVYGKFDIYVLRFAIVFRGMNIICNNDTSTEITAKEMKAATKLAEYFRGTALKVFDKVFSENSDKKITKKEIIKILSDGGASQNEIAKAVKVSQQYVCKILNKG